MEKTWKKNNYKFERQTTFFGDEIISVSVKDGNEEYHLTTIRPEEMKKKNLDFYSDKDVEYFKKTYR